MQALDFSLLFLSVNHDQDLCKMIIFTIVLGCFVHCMAESIQQQMKQITEPKFSPLKIPYFETNLHSQKRGKFTENKVRVLLKCLCA